MCVKKRFLKWKKQPQLVREKQRTVPEENLVSVSVNKSSSKKARTDQTPEKKSENVLQEYSPSILNQFSNQEGKGFRS